MLGTLNFLDDVKPHKVQRWSTANQLNEFVAFRSLNDVEKALFVAAMV